MKWETLLSNERLGGELVIDKKLKKHIQEPILKRIIKELSAVHPLEDYRIRHRFFL